MIQTYTAHLQALNGGPIPEHSGYNKDTQGGTPGIVSKGRGMQSGYLRLPLFG